MVSQNFRQWAYSLSGCDGGNLNADTWLCGIEWGGASTAPGNYYDELEKEINAGEAEPYYKERFDWQESLTYPYGRSFAKLFSAIQGKNVEHYEQAVDELTGYELLKLNLYPIAFDSSDESLWKQYKLDEITGFDEKHLFQTWCFLNRFPLFTKMRQERKPKLIICSGISYLLDFFLCFAGDQNNCDEIHYEDIVPQSNSNKQNKRRYYWCSLDNGTPGKDTMLVVIPFFSGPYGLNSDYLLQQMGNKIRDKQINK